MSEPASEDGHPRRVGPWQIDAPLGRGGMGVVYRAYDQGGHVAAVKLLSAGALRSRAEVSRFQREANIRLEHPNVVHVLDAGVHEGRPYIALELLEGETLAQRVTGGPLTVEDATDAIRQATEGLIVAHEAGIVHRDLKPSNLFITREGTVKLIDFGIARLQSSETQLTATGSVLGTPAYLSPEQADGSRAIDGRSDLFSLGVSYFELLTGNPPFKRGSALATMLAVMIESPPSLATVAPHVPPSVEGVIRALLAKNPDDRVQSARALADVLGRLDPTAPSPAAGEPLAHAVTSVSEPISATIKPGEERVVAVLLASRIRDAALLRSSVEADGGTLLPLAGDRAIGLFGGEAWEGDEVDRAAHAARAARASARYLAVASGRASYSGVTGIAGSALESAEAGVREKIEGIALDPQAARALSGRYSVEEIRTGIFMLRDRVVTPNTSFPPPPGRTRTIGRDVEIAQLRATVQQVLLEERLGLVWLIGPPGIGKSHLQWEAVRAVEDTDPPFQVLHARAEPRKERAFSLWETVLRSRARLGVQRDEWSPLEGDEGKGALAALVQEALPAGRVADECSVFVAELLGMDVNLSLELTAERDAARQDPVLMSDRVRLALIDWVTGHCERHPTALILEDLHWADDASLELLAELREECADVPLFVAATARPELLEARPELFHGPDTKQVALSGLTERQVGDLARLIAGRPLEPEVVARLTERTAGNPLFVEQIIMALREEHEAPQEALADPTLLTPNKLPLPLTVEAAVQSRLDHLPGDEKELCKRAAVFEDTFATDDLEALGMSDVRRQLSALTRRDILTARARSVSRTGRGRDHRYRSSLVRDVAYRLLAIAIRQDLHRRVAERRAETGGDPEDIAFHWERGGELASASDWYETAALGSARRGDAAGVLRAAGKVIELGGAGSFALHLARSEALAVTGRFAEQGRALEDALASAGDDAQLARVRIDQAVSALRTGRSERAQDLATEAVALAAEIDDARVAALTFGRHAAIQTYLGDLSRAEESLQRATALADAEPSVGPLLASWEAQLASARGDLVGRRAAYQRAAELYEQAGDARRSAGAWQNLADVYNRLGAFDAAANALRDSLEKCRRVGAKVTEGYSLANLGYALLGLGDRVYALEVLEQARELAEVMGETRLELWVDIYRARALSSDDPGRAAELALDVCRRAVAAKADTAVVASKVAAADALLATDLARASALTDEAFEVFERLGGLEEDEAELFVVASRVRRAEGRVDEAEALRARGRKRLLAVANKISDPAVRRSFLAEVPSHAELVSG